MNKVVSIEEIKKISQKAKEQRQTIVFTNGCFDILHPGHIRCLHKAKELGDILIVGLNTDSSVKKLKKGKSRPIFKEKDRAEVLTALSDVDYVVFFNEETPHNLISVIRPHILVKGGDYKIEKVVGRKIVSKVVIVPLLKGYSTTELINKIKSDFK